MDRKPSSNENITSSGTQNRFICTVCFRAFHTGQALGGHQNAHLLQRSLNSSTPNILGAVLNRLPPEEVQSLTANMAKASSKQDPAHGVQSEFKKQQDKSMTGRESGDRRVRHRVRYGSSHRHDSYEKEEYRRRKLTKNLLKKGKLINIVGEEASKEEFSGITTTSRSVKVSRMEDAIDLELGLSRSEGLDLELKLGF